MDTQIKPKLFTSSYIIAFIIAILSFCANSLLMTVIPMLLAQKMGASNAQIGSVLGFSSIGIIIFRPLIGYALDRYGRKKILLSSLFLGALTIIGFLFAKNPLTVFIFRFLHILPYAGSTTALVTIATDIVPLSRRGEGISYFTTCSTLALAIGPGIGLALYNSNWYLWPFVASAIGGFLCFILAFLIKTPKVERVTSRFSFKTVFDRRVMGVAVVSGIAFMGATGMYGYSSLYAEEIGLSSSNVSQAFTLFAISLLITRLLSSKTMDKSSPKFSVSISLLLFSLGLGIMGIWPFLPGFLTGASILGAGMGIILPSILTMAIQLVPPQRRGICNGLVYMANDVGGSVGAFLFGLTSDIFQQYSYSYILFSLFEFLAIFLYLLIVFPFFTRERNKVDLESNINSGLVFGNPK